MLSCCQEADCITFESLFELDPELNSYGAFLCYDKDFRRVAKHHLLLSAVFAWCSFHAVLSSVSPFDAEANV